MKRNFLLMLLLTLLPLVGWADNVSVGGGYTASFADVQPFNNGYPYVLEGKNLPVVTGFSVSGNPLSAPANTFVPALEDATKYEVYKMSSTNQLEKVAKNNGAGEDALALGNYFLKFQIVNANQVTVVYVPFRVFGDGAGKYDVVLNAETWSQAMAEDRGLYYYYQKWPWHDLGKEDEQTHVITNYKPWEDTDPAWFKGDYNDASNEYDQSIEYWTSPTDDPSITNGQKIINDNGWTRSWAIMVENAKTNPEGLPWIIPYGFTEDAAPVKLLFLYEKGTNNTVYPWTDGVFGGPNGKKFGVASAYYEFHEDDWKITNPNQTTAFNPDKFQMLLVPAAAMPVNPAPASEERRDITVAGKININNPTLTFNGLPQKPVFTAVADDPSTTDVDETVAQNATVIWNADNEAMVEGRDFTVTFSGNDFTNAGQKAYTITGIGLYKGTVNTTYTINKFVVGQDNFSLNTTVNPAQFQFDGTDKNPGVVGRALLIVKDSPVDADFTGLTSGTDFDVVLKKGAEEVSSAILVGEYTLTVNPKGNYKKADNDNITFNFEVQTANLENYAVSVNEGKAYIYNTNVQKPTFSGQGADSYVTANIPEPGQSGLTPPLVYGTDYTVTYSDENSKNAGTYTFTITGTGNYSGTIDGEVCSYTIERKPIGEVAKEDDVTAPTYNGEDFTLVQKNFNFVYGNDNPLQLGEDKDFTWELDKSSINPDDYDTEDEYQQALEEYETSAGDKQIIVKGKGNYTGEWTTTVKMKQYIITITTADANKIYGQEDPRPNFTVDSNSSAQVAQYSDEWYYIQSFLKMERYNNQTNEESIKENVGGHDYIIVWDTEKDPDDCNYQIVIQNNTGILKIDPAPLTVTIAQSTKVYSGDPATDPDFTADKGDKKFKIMSGEDDKTNAKDFVDNTKNLKEVLNIGRKPGEDVKDSPYEFTWDNPNYAVTFRTYNVDDQDGFVITPKSVQLDIVFNEEGYEYIGNNVDPVPTVKIKGTDTELTYEKDFNVVWNDGQNGNNRRDVTVGNNEDGNHWPWANISQVVKGNYTFATVNYKYYKITPATLKIAALSDNSKVYNTSDPTPLSRVTFADGFGPKGTDYWRYNTNGQLESNFTFTPALLTRETGESVGNYEISVDPAAKTRNYIVESTAKANFHIYRSEDTFIIAFEPDPKNITYGDEIDLTTLVQVQAPDGYTGNQIPELLNYVKTKVKKYQLIDPETGEIDENGEKTYIETNNAGSYKLTIDKCPTTFYGYKVIVDEGVLNINPFPLYIIANATPTTNTKEYGDEDPEFTWDVYEKRKGLNNEDIFVKTTREDFEVPQARYIGNSDATLTDLWRYTITRTEGENVGEYSTHIRNWRRGGALAQNLVRYDTQYDGNYSFEFHDGIFEITRRDLTVTVTGASKFYGEYDPRKQERATRLVPRTEEEEEDNIEMFTNGLVRIKIENALTRDLNSIANKVDYRNRAAGETANNYQVYDVTFAGTTNPNEDQIENYNLTFVANNVQFQIEKRVLKVTATDQSVPYANPLVVDPYALTITEGILIDNQYQESADVNYDSEVTVMSLLNSETPVINDKVTDVFKPLTVVEGVTEAGWHEDAFVLELTDAAKQNYVLEFTNGQVLIQQLNDIYLDMANLAQALYDHQGRTVTVHMVGATNKEEGCDPFRQFVAYQWNTFVLPFSAMPREIVAPFRYGAIDILDEANTNEGSFRLGLTTRRVAANQPFLIQTDKNMKYDDMQNVKWENVQIAEFDYLNQDPTAEDAAGNKFVGTYKPKSDFTDANYIMRANTGEFFRFIAGEGQEAPSYAMKQTEAYLEAVNPAAGVRIFIDEEDGSTTAIDFVEGETKTINAEGAFNLSGQRVSKTQKGILIIDGKKVLVK